MLCLLMVKKRLLIDVLLVKQKFIRIVPGPVNGELQISGFPANFPGEFAVFLRSPRFDHYGVASELRSRVSFFTWLKSGKLQKLPTIAWLPRLNLAPCFARPGSTTARPARKFQWPR